MQDPKIKENLMKQLCKRIVVFAESFIVKHLFRPIFFLLPPMTITAIATRRELREQSEELLIDWLGSGLGAWAYDSSLLILLGAYLYVVIMKFIYAAIKSYSKPEKELLLSDVVAILGAINIVTADKMKRMSEDAKKFIDIGTACGNTIFRQVTRPDQQIGLLVRGIRTVFETINPDNATFRVGLIRVKNRKPHEWYAFEPHHHPPRTSIEVLSSPSSTISCSIKAKSMIVVEDIKKELSKKQKGKRRFVRGSTQEDDEGSQLCYPITHPATQEVEYVITIAGDRKLCLQDKYKEIYAWILDHFVIRLSLEHNLLIMRERVDESKKQAA